MRLGPLVAVVVLVATLAGCSGASKSADGPAPALSANPTRSQLIAKAHLDPCPEATSSSPSGHALPRLTLPCLATGPAVDLAELAGRPTVVNIWGSWCVPCQAEATYFSRAYDELKSSVRILGVDTEDDPDSALDFAAHVSPPMTYPSVVDANRKLLIALHNPSAVPATLFVTANGSVAHETFGPYRSLASLKADIARYLGVHQ